MVLRPSQVLDGMASGTSVSSVRWSPTHTFIHNVVPTYSTHRPPAATVNGWDGRITVGRLPMAGKKRTMPLSPDRIKRWMGMSCEGRLWPTVSYQVTGSAVDTGFCT